MNKPDIVEKDTIPRSGTALEIYNSKEWWQLRKDMLEGKLLNECKHCTAGNSDYYRLKEVEL